MSDDAGATEAQPPEEMVPKSKYNSDKQGLLNDVVSKREEIRTLKARVQELEDSKSFDPSEYEEAEKKLFERNESLVKKERELNDRLSRIAESERQGQVKTLVAQYGVDELELQKFENVAEMKAYALEQAFNRSRQEQEAATHKAEEEKKKAEEKAKRPRYEAGGPGAGGLLIADVNVATPEGREALRKIEERLKREASLKR